MISSGATEDAQRGLHGIARVALGLLVLEDHHETVARRLVDVAAIAQDLVEEGPEVALDHDVDAVGIVALRQPGVAGDVHEEHGHVHLALGELGRLRRLLDELLDPARHELRQAGPDGLEDLDAPKGVGEPSIGLLQRRIGPGVLEATALWLTTTRSSAGPR